VFDESVYLGSSRSVYFVRKWTEAAAEVKHGIPVVEKWLPILTRPVPY
jgi:hypothetical protein